MAEHQIDGSLFFRQLEIVITQFYDLEKTFTSLKNRFPNEELFQKSLSMLTLDRDICWQFASDFVFDVSLEYTEVHRRLYRKKMLLHLHIRTFLEMTFDVVLDEAEANRLQDDLRKLCFDLKKLLALIPHQNVSSRGENNNRIQLGDTDNCCCISDDTQPISAEDSSLLHSLIEQLTPEEQEVLHLRYGLEEVRTHSVSEVSAITGHSIPTVYELEASAIGKLRTAYPNADPPSLRTDSDEHQDEPSLRRYKRAPYNDRSGIRRFRYKTPSQKRPQIQLCRKTDDIQFRCAAPMVIKPGKYFTAKIMMFREDDTDRADKEAALMEDKVRVASSDVIDAEKGQEFTLRLQSPDLPELDEVKTIRWNGKYAARDFQILLPSGYDREQLRLLGRVYSGMTPMTDISLILEISNPFPQNVRCEKVTLRTAFVSYASKDRAEVVKRIQGMETVRKDMDIFIDVESLRRGEEYEPRLYQEISDRDLFFLFWSRNAAASKWVNKELTYAVEHKPMMQIEPISLEDPDLCPPPEVLQHRHFRDWTLKYTT